MTSTAKTGVTADMSGLVDGTIADAADVLNPVIDLLNHARNGRMGVTAADTHVKHLNDAIAVGIGLEKTLLNPGGDEILELKARTAIVPFTVLGIPASSITISAIPATYEHLLLVLGIRSGAALSQDTLDMYINGDPTPASYAALMTAIQHNGSLTTTEQLEGAVGAARLSNIAVGGLAPAGYQTVIYMNFYEYATTGRPRTIRWHAIRRHGNGSGEITLLEGWFMWKNTAAAISSISLNSWTGLNINAGSSYALYGIR